MEQKPSFCPPLGLKGPHVQTILASLRERFPCPSYARECFELPDGDFIDLDWLQQGRDGLAILLHGLEGNASRPYVTGMAAALHGHGYDICAMNFRGCSGRPNRLLTSYHSGFTADLRSVLEREQLLGRYRRVILVGFSAGGNILLKYLGEQAAQTPERLHSAMAVSVPCDLQGSAELLARKRNFFYMQHFLPGMKAKLEEKALRFPGKLDLQGLWKIRSFYEFDERFTAPLHGYGSAQEYWQKNSSMHFLPNIRVPTLLVQALDDPFLSESCYPTSQDIAGSSVLIEQTRYGGHLGFLESTKRSKSWIERRALDFFTSD